MVSTSNAPGGLFERIEKDSERECLYKRLKMDYNYELDKIYDKQKKYTRQILSLKENIL
jgi:hypothetical protein